jgi:alpha-ketoglutarate-dependent taurine dioxygenase
MERSIIRVESKKNILLALENHNVVLYNGNGSIQDVIDITEAVRGKSKNSIHGEVRDLKKSNPLSSSVGASFEPHPPHTDGCYTQDTPSYIMLQSVIEDCCGGGLGLYWALKNFYTYIPNKFYGFLKEFPVKYSRKREYGESVDSFTGSIISQTHYDEKPKLRWRFDCQVRPLPSFELSKSEQKEFDEAITWVINYFHTEIPTVVPYRRNDIVIASNQYITHGRTRILDPNRHMRRIWLDIEEQELVSINTHKI